MQIRTMGDATSAERISLVERWRKDDEQTKKSGTEIIIKIENFAVGGWTAFRVFAESHMAFK